MWLYNCRREVIVFRWYWCFSSNLSRFILGHNMVAQGKSVGHLLWFSKIGLIQLNIVCGNYLHPSGLVCFESMDVRHSCLDSLYKWILLKATQSVWQMQKSCTCRDRLFIVFNSVLGVWVTLCIRVSRKKWVEYTKKYIYLIDFSISNRLGVGAKVDNFKTKG